jgi:hypothetical protein
MRRWLLQNAAIAQGPSHSRKYIDSVPGNQGLKVEYPCQRFTTNEMTCLSPLMINYNSLGCSFEDDLQTWSIRITQAVRTVRNDDDHAVDPGSSRMQIKPTAKPTSNLMSSIQTLVPPMVWKP